MYQWLTKNSITENPTAYTELALWWCSKPCRCWAFNEETNSAGGGDGLKHEKTCVE